MKKNIDPGAGPWAALGIHPRALRSIMKRYELTDVTFTLEPDREFGRVDSEGAPVKVTVSAQNAAAYLRWLQKRRYKKHR